MEIKEKITLQILVILVALYPSFNMYMYYDKNSIDDSWPNNEIYSTAITEIQKDVLLMCDVKYSYKIINSLDDIEIRDFVAITGIALVDILYKYYGTDIISVDKIIDASINRFGVNGFYRIANGISNYNILNIIFRYVNYSPNTKRVRKYINECHSYVYKKY